MAGESLGAGLEPICEGLLDGNLRFRVWRRLLHRGRPSALQGPTSGTRESAPGAPAAFDLPDI